MTRGSTRTLVTFFVVTYAVMWTAFFSVAAMGIPAGSALGTLLVLLSCMCCR